MSRSLLNLSRSYAKGEIDKSAYRKLRGEQIKAMLEDRDDRTVPGGAGPRANAVTGTQTPAAVNVAEAVDVAEAVNVAEAVKSASPSVGTQAVQGQSYSFKVLALLLVACLGVVAVIFLRELPQALKLGELFGPPAKVSATVDSLSQRFDQISADGEIDLDDSEFFSELWEQKTAQQQRQWKKHMEQQWVQYDQSTDPASVGKKQNIAAILDTLISLNTDESSFDAPVILVRNPAIPPTVIEGQAALDESEALASHRSEARTEQQPKAKSKAKAEVKAPTRAKVKVVPDAEQQPKVTTEAPKELKAEEKAEAQTTAEAQTKAKVEVVPDAEQQPKVTTETQTEVKAEAKTKAKVEVKVVPDAEQQPKATTKPPEKVKPEVKAEAKTEAKAKFVLDADQNASNAQSLREAFNRLLNDKSLTLENLKAFSVQWKNSGTTRQIKLGIFDLPGFAELNQRLQEEVTAIKQGERSRSDVEAGGIRKVARYFILVKRERLK